LGGICRPAYAHGVRYEKDIHRRARAFKTVGAPSAHFALRRWPAWA